MLKLCPTLNPIALTCLIHRKYFLKFSDLIRKVTINASKSLSLGLILPSSQGLLTLYSLPPCPALMSPEGLTHSRGFSGPLVGRCTCMVMQACPQRPQSQSAGYWWAYASGRPAWYPGSGCSTDHPSWSKTGPSSSRCPQGNPPPAGLGWRNSSNHLEGRRILVFLLFSLKDLTNGFGRTQD